VEVLSPALEVLISYYPSHQTGINWEIGFHPVGIFLFQFYDQQPKALLAKFNSYENMKRNNGCVTLWALPLTLKGNIKGYLKAKEELWKPQIFQHANR
jgi:hypothetical protein